MKVIKLITVALSCLLISSCQFNLSKQCFNPQPGDSNSFGASLAMSDNYLAVGDPQANRVVIYSRNRFGRWGRNKEIVPTKDSLIEKEGYGFGTDIELDGENLIIFTSIEKGYTNTTNQKYFTKVHPSFLIFQAIDQVNLDKKYQLNRIATSNNNTFPGSLFAANKNVIAFVTMQRESSRFRFSGQIKLLSTKDEKNYVSYRIYLNKKQHFFIHDLAIYNNFLLVRSSSINHKKSLWLFDLEFPNKKPQKIKIPDTFLGRDVAISEQFVVVSNRYGTISSEKKLKATMIKSIKNGFTITIEGHGKISLDDNILTRWHYGKKSVFSDPNELNVLEVFSLEENAQPNLILKRKGISNGLVKNHLLTTVQEKKVKGKLCIERLPYVSD